MRMYSPLRCDSDTSAAVNLPGSATCVRPLTSREIESELRILILEDDPADAELIRLELKRGGVAHVSKCVAIKRDFLTALVEFKPSLILADHKLPGLTGTEALTLTRQKFPDLPLILVTGTLGEEMAVEMIKRGATDYILKDRLSQLVPAVLRAVREAEQTTRRRCAQQSLRESEERFRQLTEAIREVFWMTNGAKTEMIYISPGYEEIWGRTCESLYASPLNWVEAIHPDDRERVLKSALLNQESGRYDEEYRIVRPDGSTRWIHDRAFPIRDKSGNVYRIAGIAEDITSRRKVEEALQKAEANYRSIYENAVEGIFQTTPEGRYLSANPALVRMLGFDSEENLIRSVQDISQQICVQPESRIELKRRLEEDGFVRNFENQSYRKDGSTFWISINARVVRGTRAEVLYFEGTSEDITERKRAEEQIRLLANGVHCTQDLISVTDQENRFTFVNQAFLQAYQYEEKELLGRKPDFLYSPQNPRGLCEEVFQQTLRGGWQGEILNCRKDGTEFSISLSTSKIKDSQGRVIGLVAVAKDISERKRAEKRSAAFAQLAYRLSAATAPKQAAAITLDVASNLIGCDSAFIYSCSQSKNEFVPLLKVDSKGEQPLTSESLDAHLTQTLHLIQEKGGRLFNARDADSSEIQFCLSEAANCRPASTIGVPIRSGGATLGVVSLQSSKAHAYSPDDLSLLQALADDCGDTLERIRIADALQVAESKYRNIFENATEGIFQATPEGRFVLANPAMARMFGHDSPEALISNFVQHERTFVIPEKLTELRRVVAEHGFVKGFEAERYRKDGSTFWVSINVHAVRDNNGAYFCFQGTEQDITERKRAEAVLRESEEKFRTLYETARIGIALHDVTGHYVQANQAYRRMLGYTENELRALSPHRDTHPDDLERRQLLFGQLCAGEIQHYERERRYLHKDGHVVWGHLSASAVRSACGQLIYIFSIVEDITERKAAVEALRQSERKLRLIAENTTDVIFAFDMDRRPVYVNPAVKELTGYSSEEILERGFIDWIAPDDQERMSKHWEALYAGKAYSDVEFRLVTRTGQLKWCSSTWGPLFDEHGRQIGVQGSERDITERKELEQELLVNTSNERRRIGHELHDGLGQYLAGIAFRAKALEQTLASEATAHATEAKELATLISNAISQTRSLARGLDPIEVETIGLSAALQNLSSETEKFFEITCQFRCTESPLQIEPQTALALYRIAQEAIHNAISHGEARRIEIELTKDSSQLGLRIHDNGVGFEAQTCKQGGMGLRVMQYRARSVGANLMIRSQLNQGTEIRCLVPRMPAPAAEDHPAS